MKYIISESQHKRLKEEIYNSDKEDNIFGDPTEDTIMVADFLVRQGIVDIERILINNNDIEIFGFEEPIMEYFMDNSITMQVYGINNDIKINVTANDYEDDDYSLRDEVFSFIAKIAEKFPFVKWYIEGDEL